MQADFGKRFGCGKWWGDAAAPTCILKQTQGELSLSATAGGALETVEMTALVATSPRRAIDETRSRSTVKTVVRQLLPEWQQGPEWLEKALLDTVHWGAKNVLKIGSVTVLVQSTGGTGTEDIYASVIVTKKASLEEWEGDDSN